MKLHFSRAKRPFPLVRGFFALLAPLVRALAAGWLVTSPSYYCDSPYRINDHINVYIIPYCHHSFDNHLSHIQRKLMERKKTTERQRRTQNRKRKHIERVRASGQCIFFPNWMRLYGPWARNKLHWNAFAHVTPACAHARRAAFAGNSARSAAPTPPIGEEQPKLSVHFSSCYSSRAAFYAPNNTACAWSPINESNANKHGWFVYAKSCIAKCRAIICAVPRPWWVFVVGFTAACLSYLHCGTVQLSHSVYPMSHG